VEWNWKHRALIRMAALCLTPSMLAQQPVREFAGYVFGIDGSWRLGPGFVSDVVMGQGIPNNSVVRLNVFSNRAFIRIGLIDKTIVELNCATVPQRCREQTAIQVRGTDDSLSARLRQIWNKLTAPPPSSLVLASTRGASTSLPPPEEYVIALTASPDFTLIPDLGSEASLRPARGGGRIDLTILPGNRARASSPLKPSLYLLRRASMPGRRPAAVLLVDADRLSQAQTDLDEAKSMSASWPPEAAHAFRVSLLEELSYEFSPGR
jgi:hypothetical protein